MFLLEYIPLFVKYYSCRVFFFIRHFRISEKKAKFAQNVEKASEIKRQHVMIKTIGRFD